MNIFIFFPARRLPPLRTVLYRNKLSVKNPLALAMGSVNLPIYTIIDMIETAENVWSDSTVCAITDHELSKEFAAAKVASGLS